MLLKPRRRVEIWALIIAYVFSTLRISEYVESTGRIRSRRGLRFKRDVKCMTFTLDKRPEHALHEGAETRLLFCNPMLMIVAMCIARNGFRAGYNKPLMVHDFRVEGLILTNNALSKNERKELQARKRKLILEALLRDRLASSMFIKATIRSDALYERLTDKPEIIPTQCNPLIYGGTLAALGFYPNYLGDESLPPEVRMRQFPETAEWKDHIYNQYSKDSKLLACPLRQQAKGELD
ncbi:hypothetical protein CC80DRAFT_499202 [Byssothecium circinans]|uniref:Uncharacterized protein n=1 Tax=Byssothecium circinans TaxID=147558 RepID=A0A6A5UCJ0_9PLEO|nr:hypothetical protein CC80DRAFT_499202 [Byssothecium circinans]